MFCLRDCSLSSTMFNTYAHPSFNFTKDLVLKSCLVLNDISDITFKVDNFQQDNMKIIEDKWGDVVNALRLTVDLIGNFGYSRETLTSNNAIIPIAYYLMRIGSPKEFVKSAKYRSDRDQIQKWLIRSLLKRVFSGSSDTFLSQIRRIISASSNGFPLVQITQEFLGSNRSILFSDDEIQHLFSYEYGKNYTFSALVVLYPSLDFRNRFHQDHIFPKNSFKPSELKKLGINDEVMNRMLDKYNYLANLQMLEGTPNQEKSDKDFKSWLYGQYPDEIERRDYMRKHYIPENIDLSLENFEEFIDRRMQLMIQEFIRVLK